MENCNCGSCKRMRADSEKERRVGMMLLPLLVVVVAGLVGM
jgi:hypothetical protein